MPEFTIIIPTYNRAVKLERAIKSVLNQSFKDFEILVMDDGSKDNTYEVVQDLSDTRIYYEWAENSGGPATPRNRGIEKAKADWICFLDADDIWYKNKLETVLNLIKRNPNADVICHNEIRRSFAEGKTQMLTYGPYEKNFYKRMLVDGNRVSTSTVTIRKSFLNKYGLRFNQSKDYVALEDYDLWLHIALYGGVFHFIDKALGEYVIENDNISSNRKSIKNNRNILLNDHVYKIQTFKSDKEKLWRQISVRLTINEIKNLVLQGNFNEPLKILFNTILTNPLGLAQYLATLVRRKIIKGYEKIKKVSD